MKANTLSALHLLRRAAPAAIGLLIIANFLGYALIGPNGLMSLGDYKRQKAEKGRELAQLTQQKARLAHRAELLNPRRADPDLADEMVRSQLGLVRPDEVIIKIDE